MRSLRESLAYTPVELKFGTSGLRGLASDMTDLECYINTVGFLRFVMENDHLTAGGSVYLAGDLRESTPRILRAVHRAITDQGFQTVYCGLIPTPALSLETFANEGPGIMVTGSHIPANRNGIKYIKSESEVMKVDEPAMLEAVGRVRAELYASDFESSPFSSAGMLKTATELPPIMTAAADNYRRRFTDIFSDQPLKGKKIVFYQQSAVGRDLLPDILEQLGAEVVRAGRSDVFIPIDTENVSEADRAMFRDLAAANPGLFAIVSTDGDSDRPFVIDEHGRFYLGDLVGLITARWLNADSASYPVTASDAVDSTLSQSGVPFAHTRIGSPYVIAAMNEALASGAQRVVGWEVNGGFLSASPLEINGRVLSPLPTRDALLPIVGVLLSAKDRGLSVSELFAELPQRFDQIGLIDNVPTDKSLAFIARYGAGTPENREELRRLLFSDEPETTITETSNLDGLRLYLSTGDVLHIRPSGNAPQLREYSLASTQERANQLVKNAQRNLLALLG